MSAQGVRTETGSTRARRLAVTVVAAGLLVGLIRVFVVQTFVIPSGSMEPGLQVGDRVVVSRMDYRFGSVQRGDVVVFDGDGVFAPPNPPRSLLSRVGGGIARALGSQVGETDFVKRVIGVAGDHVVCCDAAGKIAVNGQPITEPYVYPGDDPSRLPFDQVVPPGKLWVMGDHRSSSADSREHLGDPGGGMVPVDQVVGRVVAVWWPWDRATGVGRSGALTSHRSTSDSRLTQQSAAARTETSRSLDTAPRAARPGLEAIP
ncbi:MAG: signal peptidase I [Kineosporiaceae bacterium]